jgi:hypothetical protein
MKKPMMEMDISVGICARFVPPAQINAKATAYIASHPEIWAQALKRGRQIDEAEKARKASRRKERSRLAK